MHWVRLSFDIDRRLYSQFVRLPFRSLIFSCLLFASGAVLVGTSGAFEADQSIEVAGTVADAEAVSVAESDEPNRFDPIPVPEDDFESRDFGSTTTVPPVPNPSFGITVFAENETGQTQHSQWLPGPTTFAGPEEFTPTQNPGFGVARFGSSGETDEGESLFGDGISSILNDSETATEASNSPAITRVGPQGVPGSRRV